MLTNPEQECSKMCMKFRHIIILIILHCAYYCILCYTLYWLLYTILYTMVYWLLYTILYTVVYWLLYILYYTLWVYWLLCTILYTMVYWLLYTISCTVVYWPFSHSLRYPISLPLQFLTVIETSAQKILWDSLLFLPHV